MSDTKQYTARQVAEAVLKKASELLEKSELVKAEKSAYEKQFPHDMSDKEWKGKLAEEKAAPPMKAKQMSPEDAASIKAKMKKSDLPKSEDIDKKETGHEKGVHPSAEQFAFTVKGDKKSQGQSLAGSAARKGHQWANQEHRRVLNEMKAMPKPELGKMEEWLKKSAPDEVWETGDHKGHKLTHIGAKGMSRGVKISGPHVNEHYSQDESEKAHPFEGAKTMIDQHIADKKVKKSEEVEKAETGHEKGIHTATGSDIRSDARLREGGSGGSHAGFHAIVNKDPKLAKPEHEKVLGEMKAMPKPNLPKSEDLEKCGTFSTVHEKAKREGYSEESADKIAGKAKAMEKSACPNCGVMHKNDNYQKLCSEIHELGKKEKFKDQNDGKENAIPNEHASKDADQHAEGPAPKGEIHPKEKEEAPSDSVEKTPDPQKNPDEQKEGNNELAGTTPTQVGQDGKNLPGFDEMKGHLKLAKFIGYMHAKRQARAKANG